MLLSTDLSATSVRFQCPYIGEGFILCLQVYDEGVIVSPGVKGWIGGDKVDALVFHLSHDSEVVAKVWGVHLILRPLEWD